MTSINNSNDFLSSSDDDISVASETEVEPPMTKTEQKKPVKVKKVVRKKKPLNVKKKVEPVAESDNGGEASNDDAEPAVEVKTETTTTTTTTTKSGGKKKVKTALEVLCPTQEELDFIKENWGDDFSQIKDPSEVEFDETWTIRHYKLLKALETEYYKSLKGKRAKRINTFGSLELGSKAYNAMKKYMRGRDRIYHLDAYKGAIEEYIFMKFNRINAIDFNVIEYEEDDEHTINLFFQNDFLDGWLNSEEGETMLDKYQERAVKFEGGKKKRQKKTENKTMIEMTEEELEAELARRKALKK